MLLLLHHGARVIVLVRLLGFESWLCMDPPLIKPPPEKASCLALVSAVSPEDVDASTFAPSGLLGRTYTQRQNAMRSTRGFCFWDEVRFKADESGARVIVLVRLLGFELLLHHPDS
jgi:hypothetical protein